MNDKIYNSCIEKLNSLCKSSGLGDVSPIGSGLEKSKSVPFFIENGMDVDSLSTNNLYLLHTILHNFYGRGGNKTLTTKTIEKLHSKVKILINHVRFDKLDNVK